jgi:phage shock protein A
VLIAKHRRARVLTKASRAHMTIDEEAKGAAFDRLQEKVTHAEAVSQAHAELVTDNVEDQFARLEKAEEIEKMLGELKSRHALNP